MRAVNGASGSGQRRTIRIPPLRRTHHSNPTRRNTPSFGNQTIADQTFTQGEVLINQNALPECGDTTGGNGTALTYALNGASGSVKGAPSEDLR